MTDYTSQTIMADAILRAHKQVAVHV